MTSQLNVDTIVDKAGSGGTNVKIGNTSTYVSDGGAVTQNTVQGITKAWVSFDGDTFGINDSFNVSSMTDNDTGDYTVTIANDFANINYSSSVNCADRGAVLTHFWQSGDNATSSHTFKTLVVSNTSGGGTDTDSNHCDAQYFGDLA